MYFLSVRQVISLDKPGEINVTVMIGHEEIMA